MNTFIPLAHLYKFQKDFCSHLLPLCFHLYPGAFFCLLCNIKLVPWILWNVEGQFWPEYGQFWQMLARVEPNWRKSFSLKIVFPGWSPLFLSGETFTPCYFQNKQATKKPPLTSLSFPHPRKIISEDICVLFTRLGTEGHLLVKAGEQSAGKKNLFGCGMKAY